MRSSMVRLTPRMCIFMQLRKRCCRCFATVLLLRVVRRRSEASGAAPIRRRVYRTSVHMTIRHIVRYIVRYLLSMCTTLRVFGVGIWALGRPMMIEPRDPEPSR